MKPFHVGRAGAALIVVLAFIVMITILAVGLNGLMMVERPAANSHFEKTRAAQYAQVAIEQVVAKLDQNVSDPNLYWISQPGRLTVGPPTVSSTPQPVITLCSGYPTTSLASASPSPSYLQAPDLNISTLQDPSTHLITERKDPNTGRAVPMPEKWVYVRQGGDTDTSETPAFSSVNPIVGRYAYWADDESCKINYNLAWGRKTDNIAPVGDQTKIDLTALQDASDPGTDMTSQMADAIHRFITGNNYQTLQNGFFNTPKDARQVPVNNQFGIVTPTLEKYKFEVTHYNHDPDTTFFNEPRIVLTTRPDRAGWTYDASQKKWKGKNGQYGKAGRPYYIRVLANETITGSLSPQTPAPASGTNSNLDPGHLANMGASEVNDTVNFLMYYLQRTNWPMVTSGNGAPSFYLKYFSTPEGYALAQGQLRLAQLAENIIDYVRSKESVDTIVPPTRLLAQESLSGVVSYTLPNGNIFPSPPYASFMGSSRMPFITEIGIYCNPNDTSSTIVPNSNKARMTLVTEIYCPPNYGIASIPLSSLELFVYTTRNGSLPNNPITTAPSIIGATTTDYTDTLSSTTLTAGSYVTVSRAYSSSILPVPSQSGTYYMRVAVSLNDLGINARTDLVPLVAFGTPSQFTPYLLPVPFDKSVTTRSGITSLQCGDPRINTHTGTWSSQTGGGNTFGQPNPVAITKLHVAPQTPTGVPQQDTDSGGLTSDASFYMPVPAGTMTGPLPNPYGCVSSVGELGYMHTGIEGSNVAYKDLRDGTSPILPLPAGVPWRTLRLQPNNYPDTSTVPDWALMDLFTVPSIGYANAKAVAAPHDTAVGGRVNLNSVAVPFDTTQTSTQPQLTRRLPLNAVLLGCNSMAYDPAHPVAYDASKLSFSQAQNITNSVYNFPPTLAPLTNGSKGKPYGYVSSNPPNSLAAFISPGEIAEIHGVADQGEASEELVRQISNLTTARGGVFTVYSVGQAIKQTPTGALMVTGEQRSQAMLERYVPSQTPNTVKFRPVYYRNLTP